MGALATATSQGRTSDLLNRTLTQEQDGDLPAYEARALEQSAARVRHLENLVLLRKVYRNLLRAEGLLKQPSPVYIGAPDKNGERRGASLHKSS